MKGSRPRRTAILVALAGALVLPISGCLDYDETLTIQGDGSGTFEVDLKLDLSFIEEIKKIDPQPDNEDAGDVKSFLTKEAILKECDSPGVTVQKCDVEDQGPHKCHAKFTLAFKDLDSLRALRFLGDRELVVGEKGDDALLTYKFNARSVLNIVGMGADPADEKGPPPDDKQKKMLEILDAARKDAKARFTIKLPAKLTATNGDKDGDKAARWTIDKTNPKAQAALVKDPLPMEASLAKSDFPVWSKEVEAAKKRAAAEKAKTDAPKPDAPKPSKPGLGE